MHSRYCLNGAHYASQDPTRPHSDADSEGHMTDHVIGLLHTGSPDQFGLPDEPDSLVGKMLDAARRTLPMGDTIEIYDGGHYGYDDSAELEDLADELVGDSGVPVIVAAGGPQAAI